MKWIILILAALVAPIVVSCEEDIKVGPLMVGIDLSAFNNTSINYYPDNTSPPFAVTDYDGFWFEEYRAAITGDENKSLGLVFRNFANDVHPNNFLALYDMGALDTNHYEGISLTARWILYRTDSTPAGILVYSEPYPFINNSHTFLSYWLSDREELIVTSRSLTCEELNSTINSLYIEGYKENEKFLNINMRCS